MPGLIEALAEPDADLRPWLLTALEHIGPAAAAAIPVLEGRDDAARALWAIDERRARDASAHLRTETRESIMWHVRGHGPAAVARHLAELLDLDGEVVDYALTCSAISELAASHPDLLPTDSLQRHAHLPAARRLLCELRVDAYGALAAIGRDEHRANGFDVRWLAPLEGSEMLASLTAGFVAEVIKRRRAAGLATDDDVAADAIRREVARRCVPGDYTAAGIAAQCFTEATARALVPMLDRDTNQWIPLLKAFVLLDAPAQDAALRGVPARHRDRLRASPFFDPRVLTGERADAALLAGTLDALHDDSAYSFYAQALLRGPNAYAALQLAWIDRGFGTPIEPRRIAWLRAIGVRDEAVLRELAAPIAPLCHRFGYGHDADPVALAERAAAVGLPTFVPSEPARIACEAIIARLRAACLRETDLPPPVR